METPLQFDEEPSSDGPRRPYYVKQCTTPRCTTMIGARIGTPIDPPICKWCQAGTSHAQQVPA